jgi:hypothetical protein
LHFPFLFYSFPFYYLIFYFILSVFSCVAYFPSTCVSTFHPSRGCIALQNHFSFASSDSYSVSSSILSASISSF